MNTMKNIVLTLVFGMFFILGVSAQNCPNGCFDEGPNGPECGELGYFDNDNDGYGTGLPVCYFSSSQGNYASKGGDCNDNNASVKPRRFFIDSDGDGSGSSFSTLI